MLRAALAGPWPLSGSPSAGVPAQLVCRRPPRRLGRKQQRTRKHPRTRTAELKLAQGSASDRDELVALVGAPLGLLENRPDAADVHLVVHNARLERRPLLREQGVRFARRSHGTEESDDLEVVFGVPFQELLWPALAEPGVAGDVHAGFGAGDSRLPGALGAGDVAMCVELGGVLAEVPDVAVGILAVPVGGALFEPTLHVEAVVDRDTGDAFDHPGLVGDRDEVSGPLPVLHARIHPAGALQKGEPRVVHARAETRRRRRRGRPFGRL